jgi:hypothetical protein
MTEASSFTCVECDANTKPSLASCGFCLHSKHKINCFYCYITSPNLSLLESEVNNWLEKERNINVREISLHTNAGDYEMTIMVWYDFMDSNEETFEKAAKIASARA